MEDESKVVLDTLYQISKISTQAYDLPSLWEPLLDIVLKTLKCDAGTLMTLEGDFLVRRVERGMGEEIMKEPPIPSSKGGVSWGVVKSGKPAVITDIAKEKIASKTLAATMHSLVTVPMMARDQIIGVMSVFTRKERNFSDKDLSLFQTIANQAAIAIVSIRSTELLQENRKRMAELAALNELSKSITTLFNFEETLSSIIQLIVKMLKSDMGVLTLFDHKDRLLHAVSPAVGLTVVQIKDFRLRADEGLTGQVFCKGVPLMMNQIDQQTALVLQRAGIAEVRSILAAPLKVKSQTLGVIHVFARKDNNFIEEDLRLFAILSSQAAVVVNSSYMYQEIEEERKKDDALLSSIGEGVLAFDQAGKIIMLNTTGEYITGYLEEEVTGKPPEEVLEFSDKEKKSIPAEDLPMKKVLSLGRPITIGEIYLKKRNGEFFPAWLSCAATRDADDKVIGGIIVFRDISEELQVEQMKQELISIATHELRTPITGIKGYLDMILEGDTGKVGPDTKETIAEIVKINQRLADLVDDLLNVGRIEQGRIEFRPVAMDLGKLIADVVDELSIQAKDKGLELKSEIRMTNDEIKVKADPERVRQILINLVGNAIKYTETGSVTVSTEQEEKMVAVHVKDSGIGMDQEAQKRLFEKFYRVKTEKTRQITGTGLGLWIVKQLVEKQGGRIWIESEEGKGSTFHFSLPRI